MNGAPPALHPAHERLRGELELLREELARLLAEEDDLLHIVKPNLLAFYQQKIGAWELRLLAAQIGAGRIRRRLEMARAAISGGKAPDWREIEGFLDLEFIAWQQQIREATQRLEDAGRRLDGLMSPADHREFKKLYYDLVKRLHPDLHPARVDEGWRRLWERVQTAYGRSDLEELRALTLLAPETEGAPAAGTALEHLERERATLEAQIAERLRRLESVESQPPFTLRKSLDDDAWVTARRQEIEAQIAQWEARRVALDEELAPLLKLAGDGTTIPGDN